MRLDDGFWKALYCSTWPAVLLWPAVCADAAVTSPMVTFDSANYNVSPGGTLTVQVLIDGNGATGAIDPVANGLFSFGAKATFGSANASPAAVSVVPALNFLGFAPGAGTSMGAGFDAAKGNVDQGPFLPYSGSLLMTLTLTDLAPAGSDYPLNLTFYRTLGPTETSFVDGLGANMDNSISFGSATVHVVPEPGLALSAGTLALLLFGRRPARRD